MDTGRCGSCGAALAADAPWCTLCLTPRPAPGPAVPERVAAGALYPPVTAASLGRPGTEPPEAPAGWPCSRCHEPVPMDVDVCPGCGASFLDGVAGDMPTLRVPVLGDLSQRSKAQVYAIAGTVGLVLAMLVVGVVVAVAALL